MIFILTLLRKHSRPGSMLCSLSQLHYFGFFSSEDGQRKMTLPSLLLGMKRWKVCWNTSHTGLIHKRQSKQYKNGRCSNTQLYKKSVSISSSLNINVQTPNTLTVIWVKKTSMKKQRMKHVRHTTVYNTTKKHSFVLICIMIATGLNWQIFAAFLE